MDGNAPLSFYRMKYHSIPIYAEEADESAKARRNLFLRYIGFLAASYLTGVASLKVLTLASIFVAESVGYTN